MYKTYWGMTGNPFSKEIKERDAFHSQDYLEGRKRYEYLRNVRGIGLFTGLPGTGKTFYTRYAFGVPTLLRRRPEPQPL